MTKAIEHWLRILNKPILEFSDSELENLPLLSYSWSSCACCDESIEKDEQGLPVNKELLELGKEFHNKGVQFMCLYIKSHKNTPDEESELKDTRLRLAQQYQDNTFEILQKISEHIFCPNETNNS